MSWFENQLQQKKEYDQQRFEDSFYHAAGAVLGRGAAKTIENEHIVSTNTIQDILKYYNLKEEDIPSALTSHKERLEYCLRKHGIYSREISLSEKWYKDAFGPIMGYSKTDDNPVALLPGKIAGYYHIDYTRNKKIWINKENAKELKSDAYCFYRPLPQKALKLRHLMSYIKSYIDIGDIVLLILSALVLTLVGLLFPRYTKALTGPILMDGNEKILISMILCILFTAISSQLFTSIKGVLHQRLMYKPALGLQAAMIMRMLSLPASFFKSYSAGELLNRLQAVNSICGLLIGTFLGTGLMSVASLFYLPQIFQYAPALTIPVILVLIITVVNGTITVLLQMRVSERQMALKAKESGVSYSVISGMSKIKLAGAEKRFFARWLEVYADSVQLVYSPPTFLKVNSVITLGVGLIANVILYFLAVESNMSQSDFYAFTVSYSMVLGAFNSLAGVALSGGQIKPLVEMAKPFLDEVPEASDNREEVFRLSGSIELSHVSFKYEEHSPYILNDLSLKIKSGEYVAIVGKTGCGKSTLVRLLLGFEKPGKGSIFYGKKNINNLDLSSLRRHIGVVMQNGRLFQGDIYSNIVISAPELNLDAAWKAAEIAGIADDIRAMPMGMNTMLSEGQLDISGGQKQRIMIARAIAPKPKILIFDEATSALDNLTQKKVSDALDEMGCTRIVIAHRLSTIKNCDRILVMDNGKIIESGKYDELMALNGFFTELVKRQKLD